MNEHPTTVLREFLSQQFANNLPVGVSPVKAWCAEPQFFPGASGFLSASTWAEVVPGQLGVPDALAEWRTGGVLVLGNYQATFASYGRILSAEIGGFRTTWRNLGRLLRSVDPRDVFLTNSYIGLPDLEKDTAAFPLTPSFTKRCRELLQLELELLQPRSVVCLGSRSARFLATTVTGLDGWKPWPGYTSLFERGDACQLSDAGIKCLAIRHPSAVISNLERDEDEKLVAAACELGGGSS